MDSWHGKTGCPLSPNVIIINSATLSHSPCRLLALDSHSCSLSSDPYEMPLNIDMKIIRPLSYSGCSLILDMNSWTLLQSCNVVNPGKIFHLNSIGSPSIVSKVLYCDELLNHVNLSSQTVFGIFPRHNTESENA